MEILGSNGDSILYRFDGVMQSEEGGILLNIQKNMSSLIPAHPARIIMTVDDGKTISQNQILVTAPSGGSPFSSSWMMATNSSICLP